MGDICSTFKNKSIFKNEKNRWLLDINQLVTSYANGVKICFNQRKGLNRTRQGKLEL